MEGNYTEYYRWLISLIDPPASVYSKIRQHGILLFAFWRHDYFWFDRYEQSEEDRANDGKLLRERFMMDFDAPPSMVPQGPCNVLEMMVAFAIRIDNTVHDWQIGSHPWDWVEMFITNLGLSDLTDDDIRPSDDGFITAKLEKWMSHNIGPKGERGLFRFKKPNLAIDNMTNWDMMQKWVTEYLS